MKRKIAVIALAFLSLALIAVQRVEAHTPGPMTLEYDYQSKILTVTVSHSVDDVNAHYIYQISITKNAAPYTQRGYTSQESTTGMSDTFDVDAEAGDILSATAYCVISGQVTEEITVEIPATSTSNSTSTPHSSSPATTSAAPTTDTSITISNTTTDTTPDPSSIPMESNMIILIAVVGIAIVAIVVMIGYKR